VYATNLLYKTVQVNKRNIVDFLYAILCNPGKGSAVRHARVEFNNTLVFRETIKEYEWATFDSALQNLVLNPTRRNNLLKLLLRGDCSAHAVLLFANLPELLSLKLLYLFHESSSTNLVTSAIGPSLTDLRPYLKTITHLTLENDDCPLSFEGIVLILRIPNLEYLKTDIEKSYQSELDWSCFIKRSNKITNLNVCIDQADAGFIFPAIVSTCTALQKVSLSSRNSLLEGLDEEFPRHKKLTTNDFIKCLCPHKKSLESITYLTQADLSIEQVPMCTLADYNQLGSLCTSPNLFGSSIQSLDLWMKLPAGLEVLEIRVVTKSFWSLLKLTHDALAHRRDLLPKLSRFRVGFKGDKYDETEEDKKATFVAFQRRGIDIEWLDEGETDLEEEEDLEEEDLEEEDLEI
jgi:hypothetical protein